MTDFGHRALSDSEFNEQYKEQMKQFKQRILEDDTFAKQFGDLVMFMENNGEIGLIKMVIILINLKQ